MPLLDRHLDLLQVIDNAGTDGINTREIIDYAEFNIGHDIPTDMPRVSDLIYRLKQDGLAEGVGEKKKHRLTQKGKAELQKHRPKPEETKEKPMQTQPETETIAIETIDIQATAPALDYDAKFTPDGSCTLNKNGFYSPLVEFIRIIETAIPEIRQKDEKIAALIKIADSPIVDRQIADFITEIAQDLKKIYT